MVKNLRFVCAQPAIDYYTWQVEIIIHNFMNMGINPNNIDIVCSKPNGIVPDIWKKMANHYNYVRFFFYDDKRKTKKYISSIRPNLLKQHWLARPELNNDTIFYHDNDIVFTKRINWNQFLNDNVWYGSDVRAYISYNYIVSKGNDVLDKMCEIIDIDKTIVKENELNCIGAQTILKNIDYIFWEKVEFDSENLFYEITKLNTTKKEKNPNYHPIQIWCSDMWALLWNSWKMGYETIPHNDLRFSWGTSTDVDWNKNNIYHNAGVTTDKNGLFYKANYVNKLPYNDELNIKKNSASWYYWNIIKEVKEKSILI